MKEQIRAHQAVGHDVEREEWFCWQVETSRRSSELTQVKSALNVFYSEYGLAPVSSDQMRNHPFSAPIQEGGRQEGLGHNVRKTCPSHLVRLANYLQHSIRGPRKHFGSAGCTQCQGGLAMQTPTTPVTKHESTPVKEKQQLQHEK